MSIGELPAGDGAKPHIFRDDSDGYFAGGDALQNIVTSSRKRSAGRASPSEERKPSVGRSALLMRSVKSAFALLSQKVTKAAARGGERSGIEFMKRTISVMLGKGAVNHNSRRFLAANIDGERTPLNISYSNTPIKEVYHTLFDASVERYNAKQTRSDRCIDDYYEKIRTGKQEKPFYEVIFQVGNSDNMSSKSEDGTTAAKILDNFMKEFQTRNPQLHVFSAHLHMDEATPHLHIDFVPFMTGSKRGLDTRVSLKQALAAQGFTGGTRGDTEWSQWVRAEKEQLAQVMERHGIEWEQLGAHDEHLNVIDFKKVQRVKEVSVLEEAISEKQEELVTLHEKEASTKSELEDFHSRLVDVQKELHSTENKKKFIAQNASHYDNDPEYQLPEPKPFMTVKSYHDKIAAPLVHKLKNVIRSVLCQFFEQVKELKMALDRANRQIWSLSDRLDKYKSDNDRLQSVDSNYQRLRRFLGDDKVDAILTEAKMLEKAESRHRNKHLSFER